MTELTLSLHNFANASNNVLTREDHVRTFSYIVSATKLFCQIFMKFGSDVFTKSCSASVSDFMTFGTLTVTLFN